MTPVDSTLAQNLEAGRVEQAAKDLDNLLEYRSVQLESVLPESELTLAEQMAGTRVQPFDLDYYGRAKAEPVEADVMELVEMRIDLSDLPAPVMSEGSSMQPLEIMASDYGPGSDPIGFQAFVEENFSQPEVDFQEAESLLGEEANMGEMATLADIGESMASIGELLPTSDMIMGFLEGGLMMAFLYMYNW